MLASTSVATIKPQAIGWAAILRWFIGAHILIAFIFIARTNRLTQVPIRPSVSFRSTSVKGVLLIEAGKLAGL